MAAIRWRLFLKGMERFPCALAARKKVSGRLFSSLRKRLQVASRANGGFTLIELLVVIAIIGILTAFIMPKVISALSSSVANTTVNTAQEIAAALESYYSQNGTFSGLSGITYQSFMQDLQPYLPLATSETQADFYVVQAAPKAPADPNGSTNGDSLNIAASNNAYVLIIYAKNGEQTPICLSVRAGVTGNLWAGAEAVKECATGSTPAPANLAPTIAATCADGSTTCTFTETAKLPW